MNLARLIRALPALALLVVLAACDAKDMGDPPHPMGNFKMNAFFIDAQKAQTVPLSRTAKPEDWEAVMGDAMTERFGTYAGDKPFEFGISIDGYVLAPRGVPVVASPKSALIIRLHVYDSAKKQFLEEGGKRITVMEGVSGESFVGSGQNRARLYAGTPRMVGPAPTANPAAMTRPTPRVIWSPSRSRRLFSGGLAKGDLAFQSA